MDAARLWIASHHDPEGALEEALAAYDLLLASLAVNKGDHEGARHS